MRPWSLLTIINFFRTGANRISDILRSLLHLVAETTNCTATKIECFSYAKSLLIIQAYYFVNHFVNKLFLFVKIPSYLLYVWLLCLFLFWWTRIIWIQKWYRIQAFTPANCSLSEHQINLSSFLKSLTHLSSPGDLALGTAYHEFLSWDVSLALGNFYASSILKNEWKRNQYNSKVGWYS